VNYKILIDELKDIPLGGLTCGLVLELIEKRRLFLKAMNQEKKDGNWRATNKKIAVSLFSGVGGFDLGFKAAGFKIAIAIDNNPIALATYHR
jgi:C-5 cytosine-specific DNA methylase